jgi:Tfp pilus assembly protein PilV
VVSFSLVETLIANGVVVAVVLGVAQLFTVTTEMNRRAGLQTWMAICAAQKVEELRTIGSDTGAGVEHLDAHGAPVPAPIAVYEREWSVRPLPTDPERLVLVDVVVRSTTRRIEAHAIGVRPRGG